MNPPGNSKPEVEFQGTCQIENNGKDILVCTPDGKLKYFPATGIGSDMAKEHAEDWFKKHLRGKKIGVGKIVYSDCVAGPMYGSSLVATDNLAGGAQ